jgi:hypothetical protein
LAPWKAKFDGHLSLPEPAMAHLEVTELALDHPKGMLDLGPHAGLEPLDLVDEPVELAGLVQRLALARAHGDVPGHVLVCTGPLV